MKKALVVGGTSGLGFALAQRLKESHNEVIITGRGYQQHPGFTYVALPLTVQDEFRNKMDCLLYDLSGSQLETVVYNAGFYQEGKISDLTDHDIEKMINVGFTGAAMLMQRILAKQEKLARFVAVTSTSQWTPRRLEPVYTGAKAALGMLANSLSLDGRIERTLVAAPAGMKTKFWNGTGKDTSTMLEPNFVAQKIFDRLYSQDPYSYSYLRILREPPRTEIVETR